MRLSDIPTNVLAAYGLRPRACAVIASNINLTLIVDTADGDKVVLQRLHPVFGASVNDDMATVSRHLAAHGMTTPQLLKTLSGESYSTDPTGRLWRLQTYVRGVSFDTARSRNQLESAAALLASFHRALSDLRSPLQHHRPMHDTVQRLGQLKQALTSPKGRPDAVAQELGAELLEFAETATLTFHDLPQALRHGDPKLSNVLFAPENPEEALCYVDLDTVGRGPLAHELGDALRSWCNAAGENTTEPALSVELFDAAIRGYLSGAREPRAGLAPLTLRDEELMSAVSGCETICLELACRFATDVIEDSYWAWDATRFASRRDHNLVRARGQLALARSVRSQSATLLKLVQDIVA